MSAVDLAVEKVKGLDESQALRLIDWLRSLEATAIDPTSRRGAKASLGFARRFRAEPRSTADWMAELRAGEVS